jgi:hypothetical protein
MNRIKILLLIAVVLLSSNCSNDTTTASASNSTPVADQSLQGSITAIAPQTLATGASESIPLGEENPAALNCSHSGRDGEGCIRLIAPDFFVSGSSTEFMIEVTVGESGIAVGGGIAIGRHHAAEWKMQTHNAEKANHIHVESPNMENIIVKRSMPFPRTMFKARIGNLFNNKIYGKGILIGVINKPLLAGEKVRIYFGAKGLGMTVPGPADDDQEFRVTTDIDGDGRYEKTATQPVYIIRFSSAKSFTGVAPAQVVVDEPFNILVRLEDEFFNVVQNYNGKLSFYDEQENLLAKGVDINSGLTHVALSLPSVGFHRIRIKSDGDDYLGRSNPIRVYKTLPEYKLYWSDLHGHTGISDGLGKSANEYFAFGRDIAGLDVIALTDHGNFDWEANVKAVQDFHQPGKYVTLLAQEAGAGPDHMNLYFRRDDTDHISKWHKDYSNFMQWVYKQYNLNDSQEAMTGPHHYAYNRGKRGDEGYPFATDIWDERVARFVEVYSSHGTSEFKNNPRPLRIPSEDDRKYLQFALAAGLKFGIIGASDNHDSKPGRSVWGYYPGGLSGIWATQLNRESIWDSMWNYHLYGTSADRIYMEFYINEYPMGEGISTNDSVHIEAYIIGKTDILDVVIIRDNIEIQKFSTDNGLIEFSLEDSLAVGEHFYYLRVTQDNGERAWSSPIWVTKGAES